MSEVSNENDHGVLPSIPLDDTRALAEFIVSLLGQSRSSEQEFEDRRFVVNNAWLLNLHDIIEQRITSQHHQAKLVSFMSKLYYEDGRVKTLNDIESFRSFHDMSSALSLGVDLRWKYLIKFPLADHAEKQEIRFLALVDREIIWKVSRKPRRSLWSFLDKKREHLSYEVQSTNVTWGEDLCTHISNYITTKTEGISKWKCWLRKVSGSSLLPALMSLSFMGYFGWSLSRTLISVKEQFHAKYGDINQFVSGLKTVDQKLDFLVSQSIFNFEKTIALEPIPPVIELVSVTLFFFFLFYVLPERRDSFVCLNKFSEDALVSYEKRYNFIKYTLVIGSIFAIVTSLFANRIEGWIANFF